MTRFSVKNNLVLFGWEAAFKKIDGTNEAVPILGDLEWALNLNTFPIAEIKPKMERESPWYVGNSTRKPSYTYESEFKAGDGSLENPLKNARVLAAVLGVTSLTDNTTYTTVVLDGNGDRRESFFAYFAHGTKRAKSINGMMAKEVSIDAKEGEFVTFSMSCLSARMWDMTGALLNVTSTEKDPLIDIDREPFHWKQVSVKILDGDPSITSSYQEFGMSIGDGTGASGLSGTTSYDFVVNGVTYTITTIAALAYNDIITLIDTELNTDNMDCTLESGDIRIAPQSDGPLYILIEEAIADNLFGSLTGFTAFDASVKAYTNLLYETGQAYQFFDLSGVLPTDDDGLGAVLYSITVDAVNYEWTPTAGDTMEDLVGDLNDKVTDNNFLFKFRGSDIVCISIDGSAIVLAAGTSGTDLLVTLGATLGVESTSDGSEFESCKVTFTNNTEYKYGAPSSGGQETANWYKEMLFEVTVEITLYPSIVDDILWTLSTEQTQYVDYSKWLLSGILGFEIKLERDTNDWILIRTTKNQIQEISEILENIEAGVDPVTITLKIAESTSGVAVTADDPLLHTVSPYRSNLAYG